MAASLAARGHQRSREQVRCKIKDLRQSYSRACLPGADPEACPHFHALDRILGPHAVPAPRDVIDPGAEGPLLETEEEEEGSESQEPAASLPRTRDPRGTPQSRSPASSEAGEASTSAAPGPAGRTTPPAAAARARASRTARNQEDYQRRHLRFLDRQLRLQDHWVQEDLRLRQRSLEALEEQGRALRGHLQSLLDRFPFPPPPAPPLAPPAPPLSPPLAPPAPPAPPASAPASAPASSTPPSSLPPPPQPFPTDAPGPAVWRDGRGSRTPTPELSFPFLPSLPSPSSSLVPGFPLPSPTFIPPSPHPSSVK
ncbi:uncharacterized protein LOC142829009 [Pelodiscus sinensis]|uniref:uncharacterized protein LOC142829009 n=1 Tax=Pelodiscus sinensis TaxID=13735 RepID=UPI003F6C9A74